MTDDPAFVDANIFIYYLTGIDDDKAERSLNLLGRIQRRDAETVTSELVVAEVVWLLQRRTDFTREEIRDRVLPVLQFPGLRIPNKAMWPRVFEIYCEDRVQLTDAHAAAVMEQSGITRIYSFDTDFDRIEGIERLEP